MGGEGEEYPILRGGKGAEMKWLLVVMVGVWRELVGDDGGNDDTPPPPSLNHRCLRALDSLAQIINLIDEEPDGEFLKVEAANEIVRLLPQ